MNLSWIPNTLTLLNLLCGCLGLYYVFYAGDSMIAIYLIFLAAIFDFADGFIARLLKVSGELGKQLDSLADMVTFGVLPGALAWSIAGQSIVSLLACMVIPAFSALRLAKFNIDTRQSDTFIGVPTPMNTLLWCGIVSLTFTYPDILNWIQNPVVFILICFSTSLLMIIEFPMISLKIKKSDKHLVYKILLVLFSLISIWIWKTGGLVFIYLFYLLISFVSILTTSKNK